jgi:hypothetical protein
MAMKFMLMMHAPRGTGDWAVMNWSEADLKAHVAFMKNLNLALRQEGSFVSAEGLAMPSEARIVRGRPDGKPEVTDGPFAEAKEFLAGFWIVEVKTPEEAYAIAARASLAPGPGGKPLYIPLEVREVGSAPA